MKDRISRQHNEYRTSRYKLRYIHVHIFYVFIPIIYFQNNAKYLILELF